MRRISRRFAAVAMTLRWRCPFVRANGGASQTWFQFVLQAAKTFSLDSRLRHKSASQYQVVQNQELQDYVRRIGERIAATPEARNSGFPSPSHLSMTNRSMHSPLPGGPTFVHTGLYWQPTMKLRWQAYYPTKSLT